MQALDPFFIFKYLFAIIFSAIYAEVLHGTTAYLLGDMRGYRAGRLTVNPIPHVDPIGTIFFPILCILGQSLVLLAWALPIPIDYAQIRYGRIGQILVVLSRPFAHYALAFVALLLLHFTNPGSMAQDICRIMVCFNCFIGTILFVPVLPLSGGELVALLLPYKIRAWYLQHAPYGSIILLVLILAPIILNQPELDIVVPIAHKGAAVVQKILLTITRHGF